ncbi:hypothetical protein [Streptomyces sp. Ncost-T10-10d]|uniref:hypothetical protein n=1 Tax=Streptomyces sp. Ncost-T10-10d TaxID=1839774 RepID=UPI00081F6B1A|nr:hypothetical protein [Streptomyces sp. Ncost-T10-10d]SCF91832.1 hypothetical protein GA0115254_124860 [Streptomyces sp. Ncost-T10-10d]
MARPAVSDWETVFGFSDDPTPGNAEMLAKLAGQYRSVADDADQALPIVRRLKNSQLGEGKAMDKLRNKLGDLADQVEKLHSSYDKAARALDTYSDQLGDHQRKADNALVEGRDAKERLQRATDAASAAGSVISGLDAADPPPPDDEAARRSARQAMENARHDQSVAQGDVDTAQRDLDAARMLAEDARELRETDASTAARALDDATSEAVPGKSLWEKIKDIFKKVLGFISAALGIIAMLIPGLQGLGLILTIASLVTAAIPFIMNIVDSIQSGEWDVLDMVLSGLGLVLGGVGLIKIANLGGIANTLKTVTSDLKAIQINIKSVIPTIKGFTGFKNPGDLVANLLKNIPGGVLKTPDILKQLPGLTNIWTKTAGWIDQSSNLIGVAGFGWAINGAVPHGTQGTIVHDPSYVEGST